ncbi:hypothetical protein GCM10022631_31900 [Deinococcus rubellus]|uniref:Uncharacterized protein n=1 Tax=Deinococcus rubellus TaxID=1889240 RepID=A0ABY5YK37_9DEIO|nr:hypothetical protein [Deinococcus rubellus]UWX64702.1 hypothetical protein N0D28_03300 [Deinococcus rubellus]
MLDSPKPEHSVPNDVHAYLQAVTCRLPRRLRAAVAAELHANLHQRMLDHAVGLKVEDAWAAALRDFGPPQRAAQAFGQLYAWPHLLRTVLAALALGAAGYAAARSLNWEALGWSSAAPVQEVQRLITNP